MKRLPPELGTTVKHKPGQWVQTERKTHEAWANLISRKPRAAALAHHLVAQMGTQNAVVIPQTVLAKLMGCSVDTVQRAVRDLVAERWISVVRLGKGKEAAYVVNDRVAWGQSRDNLRLSVFSAAVVADFDDQDESMIGHGDLRKITTLYPGELQLPTGPGEDPPSQPNIPGIEPDLPARVDFETGEILDYQKELENRGQQRLELPIEDGPPTSSEPKKCAGGDGVPYTSCDAPKLKAVHVGHTYSDSTCENCGGWVRHSWD